MIEMNEDLFRSSAPEGGEYQELPLDQINPSPWQPRGTADPERLRELAESIRASGVIEPVVVRPKGSGWELIAGHRRWQAAEIAGRTTLPAIVRRMNDLDAALLALIENVQRDELSGWEEAQAVAGLRTLLERKGEDTTGKAIAPRIGWSEGKVSQRITIAENITEEVMAQADVTMYDVNRLSKAALRDAAQAETVDARAALLYQAVHGCLPAWAQDGAADAPPRRGKRSWTMQQRKRGFYLNIRDWAGVGQMDAEKIEAGLAWVQRRIEERTREVNRAGEKLDAEAA